MIITKLILENFQGIETGMGIRKITLDFPVNDNKIYLLTAPNGTGKTTLLSLMTPFASLGNIDVRDGYNLIISGENGYKEIHIKNNKDSYIIKHYYTYSKSRDSWSIKSYIEKNGVELNVNGNVTSFKELINEELDLELDYLKLLRLGSNVSSLIDTSETERKAFMSKLLDDVDIYLSYYKKLSKDVTNMKTLISQTSSKLNRLHIDDVKNTSKKLEDLKNQLLEFTNKRDLYVKELGALSNEKSTFSDDIKLKHHEVVGKLNKMKHILSSEKNIKSAEEYDRLITECKDSIEKLIYKKGENESAISNQLIQIDKLYSDIENKKIALDKENSNTEEITKLKSLIEDNENTINNYYKENRDFRHDVSEEQFLKLMKFLYDNQNKLLGLYEFGDKVTSKAIELLVSDENVTNWLQLNLKRLDTTNNDVIISFINSVLDIGSFNQKDICTGCPAYNTYKSIYDFVTTYNKKDKELYETSDYYYSVVRVYDAIKIILKDLIELKDVISLLPQTLKNDLNSKLVRDRISKCEPIFTENKFLQYQSLLHEESVIKDLEITNEGLKEKINMMSNSSVSGLLTLLLDKLNKELNESNNILDDLKGIQLDIDDNLNSYNKNLEVLLDLKDTVTNYESLLLEEEKLSNDIERMKIVDSSIIQIKSDLDRIDNIIHKVSNDVNDLKNRLNQYHDLTDELNMYMEHYDKMIIIRDALSSKKGMPLYYIKMYLNDTKEVANKLLNIIYDGDIILDKFDLSPNSFSIPFCNKNKLVKDVKYASQGERAFLSIALSFALSARALTKYNIMLLDEIDATLDINNREKFIEIIDSYMDMINAEQCILISHSGAFNYCPINLIDLSDTDDTELIKKYPLATIVNVIKE